MRPAADATAATTAAGGQRPEKRAAVNIGCSGWLYGSWRGSFYPSTLPVSRWLGYYASEFQTVEVNNTFYRLPESATFAAWRSATPPGFIVAVKASRFLTHLKRLRQPARPIARLLGRASALGPRLGPILFQLPATLKFERERLQTFLDALRRRTRRIRSRRFRYVVEFRDSSWYREDVFSLLRKARVAVCHHDMPGSELRSGPSCPFLYVRFHGTAGKYRGSYSDACLREWADRIRQAISNGVDAYAYFNNDVDGAAVQNARTLIRYVGQIRS